jgi:pimeloyl-ACP methyl ester carboxylesterase
MPETQLSTGRIHYRDEGTGHPLVLIHGLLVNATIWDRLIPHLAGEFRCIAPDLPLGSHRVAMDPGADLSPPGLAALIAEFIDRLGAGRVTLVGNDTGGALCQLVCAQHPDRIERLVLTNCDSFEHFPPGAFKPLVAGLAHTPGAIAALGALGRLGPVRRGSMALAGLTVDPVPDGMLQQWVAPLRDRGVRHDLRRVLRAISPEHTLAAAEALRGFSQPVLLAWGTGDKFFPLEDAERLATLFSAARLEQVEGARTFVQLDAPERLAALIKEV